jgi:hypothetical protein
MKWILCSVRNDQNDSNLLLWSWYIFRNAWNNSRSFVTCVMISWCNLMGRPLLSMQDRSRSGRVDETPNPVFCRVMSVWKPLAVGAGWSVISMEVKMAADRGIGLGVYIFAAREEVCAWLLLGPAFDGPSGTVVASRYSCRAWIAPGSCTI